MRIGVGRSLTAAELTAPGGLLVIAGGQLVGQTPPTQPVKITLDAAGIGVTGFAGRFTAVRFVPAPPAVAPAPVSPTAPPPAPANPIGYGTRRYRGEFEVVLNKERKLSVVNVVNLEEYLLSVVPAEMQANWPLEALKAQAVAARTYALSHLGRWAAEGFDLVDSTTDQEYAGLTAERSTTNAAVWLTRGQALTYNGQYVNAMYHSSSGGHTENNEVIYNSVPVPYLRGVVDYDNVPGNTRYSWQFTFTSDQLTQKVQGAGYSVGTVTGVAPAGTIGSSGRPSAWSIAGLLSSVRLTGQQLRSMLDLPSSPRTVAVQEGSTTNATRTYQATDTVTVMGPDGSLQTRTVKGTAIAVTGGAPASAASAAGAIVAVSGNQVTLPSGIVVSGGGFGHAVGMSQWGAYGMAQLGTKYVDILTHYYTGARVENR